MRKHAPGRLHPQVLIPLVLECIILVYLAVQMAATALLLANGESATGRGYTYTTRGSKGASPKSIGVYTFSTPNGRQYSARFSARPGTRWPRNIQIRYQRGFPYNHTHGEPSFGRTLQQCAPLVACGLALAVYLPWKSRALRRQ